MISAHRNPPRIVDQQIPFQTDGPLQCMHKAAITITDRHDTAATLEFHVTAEPAAAGDFVQVVPQRSIPGHAGGFTKHYLPDIHRQIRMAVHILGQLGHARTDGGLITEPTTITVKLDMRQVSSRSFHGFHGFQSRGPVAGNAQLIAVHMHWMRQPQAVG